MKVKPLVCTCDLHVYNVDTSLDSRYLKNTNFQELNFQARLSQANEERNSFNSAFFS